MKKNLIIISLIFSIIMMAIAYINFSGVLGLENMKSSGTNWNIGIKSVELISKTGKTIEQEKSTHTIQTVTFYVRFTSVGDSAKYKIEIENSGDIDAKLSNLIFSNNYSENDYIVFDIENISVGDIIKSGEIKEFYATVKYSKEANDLPIKKSETILLEFKQKK